MHFSGTQWVWSPSEHLLLTDNMQDAIFISNSIFLLSGHALPCPTRRAKTATELFEDLLTDIVIRFSVRCTRRAPLASFINGIISVLFRCCPCVWTSWPLHKQRKELFWSHRVQRLPKKWTDGQLFVWNRSFVQWFAPMADKLTHLY